MMIVKLSLSLLLLAAVDAKKNPKKLKTKAKKTLDYWTDEKVATAQYRNLDVGGDRRQMLRKARELAAAVGDTGWLKGGTVQEAVGRLLFTMPDGDYICSATAVADAAADGRSVVLTAAHCAYDDHNKAFASNALFIPNQDGTSK